LKDTFSRSSSALKFISARYTLDIIRIVPYDRLSQKSQVSKLFRRCLLFIYIYEERERGKHNATAEFSRSQRKIRANA